MAIFFFRIQIITYARADNTYWIPYDSQCAALQITMVARRNAKVDLIPCLIRQHTVKAINKENWREFSVSNLIGAGGLKPTDYTLWASKG